MVMGLRRLFSCVALLVCLNSSTDGLAQQRAVGNGSYTSGSSYSSSYIEQRLSPTYPFTDNSINQRYGNSPMPQPGDRGRVYSNPQDSFIRGENTRIADYQNQQKQRQYQDFLRRHPGVEGIYPGTNQDSDFYTLSSIYWKRRLQAQAQQKPQYFSNTPQAGYGNQGQYHQGPYQQSPVIIYAPQIKRYNNPWRK